MSYGIGVAGASESCRCTKCAPHWDDDHAVYMRRLAALRAASLSGFSAHSTAVPLSDEQLVKAPSNDFIRHAMGHYIMLLQQTLVDAKKTAVSPNGSMVSGWPTKLTPRSALTELEQLNTYVSAAKESNNDLASNLSVATTAANTTFSTPLPPPSPTPAGANKVDLSLFKPKRTYTTSLTPSPNGGRVLRDERGRPLLPSSAKPNVPTPVGYGRSDTLLSATTSPFLPSPSPSSGSTAASRSPSPSPSPPLPHSLRPRASSSLAALPLPIVPPPTWGRDSSSEHGTSATARSSLSINTGHSNDRHRVVHHHANPSTDSLSVLFGGGRPSSPPTLPSGKTSRRSTGRDGRLTDSQLSVIFAYLDTTFVLRTLSLVSRRWQTSVQLPSSCSRIWTDFSLPINTIGRLAPRWLATVETVIYDVDTAGASALGVSRVHSMLVYMSRYGRLRNLTFGNETSVTDDDRHKQEAAMIKHNHTIRCTAPIYGHVSPLIHHLTTLTKLHAWKLREFDVDLLASSSLPLIQHIHVDHTPLVKRSAPATVVASTLQSITLRALTPDVTASPSSTSPSSHSMDLICLNLSRARVLERLELHGVFTIQGAHGCAATLTSLTTCGTSASVGDSDVETRRYNNNWAKAFGEWSSLKRIDIAGYIAIDASLVGSLLSWRQLNLYGNHRMNHQQVSQLAAAAMNLSRLAPPSREFVRRLARGDGNGAATGRLAMLPPTLSIIGIHKFDQILVMIPSRALLKQITWPLPKNVRVTHDGPNGTIVYSDEVLGTFVATNRLAWLSGEQLGPFHRGPPCGNRSLSIICQIADDDIVDLVCRRGITATNVHHLDNARHYGDIHCGCQRQANMMCYTQLLHHHPVRKACAINDLHMYRHPRLWQWRRDFPHVKQPWNEKSYESTCTFSVKAARMLPPHIRPRTPETDAHSAAQRRVTVMDTPTNVTIVEPIMNDDDDDNEPSSPSAIRDGVELELDVDLSAVNAVAAEVGAPSPTSKFVPVERVFSDNSDTITNDASREPSQVRTLRPAASSASPSSPALSPRTLSPMERDRSLDNLALVRPGTSATASGLPIAPPRPLTSSGSSSSVLYPRPTTSAGGAAAATMTSLPRGSSLVATIRPPTSSSAIMRPGTSSMITPSATIIARPGTSSTIIPPRPGTSARPLTSNGVTAATSSKPSTPSPPSGVVDLTATKNGSSSKSVTRHSSMTTAGTAAAADTADTLTVHSGGSKSSTPPDLDTAANTTVTTTADDEFDTEDTLGLDGVTTVVTVTENSVTRQVTLDTKIE